MNTICKDLDLLCNRIYGALYRHFSSIRILHELQVETRASNTKDNIKPQVNGGIIVMQVCHALVYAD